MFGIDGSRPRISILIFLVGAMLLLLALATYVSFEQGQTTRPARELTDAQKAELRARVSAPARIMLWTIGLTFGFIGAAYVFLCWSRAYRAKLTRPPLRPTPVEDLWSMHRLPEPTTKDSDAGPDDGLPKTDDE